MMVFGFKERPRHFSSDPRPPQASPRFGAPRPERPRDPANLPCPAFLSVSTICNSRSVPNVMRRITLWLLPVLGIRMANY